MMLKYEMKIILVICFLVILQMLHFLAIYHRKNDEDFTGMKKSFTKNNQHEFEQNEANPFPYPNVGGYPGHIKEELIFLRDKNRIRPANPGEEFVIINHSRFNYSVWKKMMPNDTIFISVVRKPWNNFQSTFHFYYNSNNIRNMRKSFQGLNCPLYPYFHIAQGRPITFVEYLELVFDLLNQNIPCFFRSKNFQSYDLGLDPLLEDENEIAKAVQKLGSQIDFMMITDHMDESLILLKDLLCMSWSDILITNTGKTHRYTPMLLEKNETVTKRFNQFYKLDLALYEYFNDTFWKKVDAYGREKMLEDVQKLRQLREEHKQEKQLVPAFVHDDNSFQYEVTMLGQQMFHKSQNNYNETAMTNILKRKLRDTTFPVNSKQIDKIAQYIVQNNGGSPVDPRTL